jgi:hypothetical protein
VPVTKVPEGFKAVGEINVVSTETDMKILYAEAARIGQEAGCDAVFNVPLRNSGFFGPRLTGRASFAADDEGRFLCAMDLLAAKTSR